MISIHAPTRGATISVDAGDLPRNFNPRSHEGSDNKEINATHGIVISIHAPTRGATIPMTSTGYVRNFNLRSHEGSDTVALETLNSYLNFNPRSHEGSDYSRLWALLLHQYFNPRSHEGSDDNGRVLEAEYLNFNPRSHEGSDSISFDICTMTAISIHAPTRGATEVDPAKYYDQGISIHAPTRGATCFTHSDFPFLLYFNPRSHEGSDGKHTPDLLSLLFQSTLPRGERPAIDPQLNSQYRFQSTLPRGERPDLTSGGTW